MSIDTIPQQSPRYASESLYQAMRSIGVAEVEPGEVFQCCGLPFIRGLPPQPVAYLPAIQLGPSPFIQSLTGSNP